MIDVAGDAEYFEPRCPRIRACTGDTSGERDREGLCGRLANRASGVPWLEVGASGRERIHTPLAAPALDNRPRPMH